MRQSDQSVRLAVFRILDEQVRLSGEDGSVRRSVLQRGFVLDGERVPLLGPAVTYAIATGILNRQGVPEDWLEYLATALEFYAHAPSEE